MFLSISNKNKHTHKANFSTNCGRPSIHFTTHPHISHPTAASSRPFNQTGSLIYSNQTRSPKRCHHFAAYHTDLDLRAITTYHREAVPHPLPYMATSRPSQVSDGSSSDGSHQPTYMHTQYRQEAKLLTTIRRS